MEVELEASLNADSDPTSEFVIRRGLQGHKGRKGMFENDTVFDLAKDADPVLWWKSWGSATCLELTTVAMCFLAQPCSASSVERVWSAYGRVHTDARNRLSKVAGPKCILTAER